MLEACEDRDQLVQQVHDLLSQRTRIEQAGDGAEQIAEQIARPGCRRDVEHDLIQIDHQAEQLEVKWPQHEVEDVAGGRRWSTTRTLLPPPAAAPPKWFLRGKERFLPAGSCRGDGG